MWLLFITYLCIKVVSSTPRHVIGVCLFVYMCMYSCMYKSGQFYILARDWCVYICLYVCMYSCMYAGCKCHIQAQDWSVCYTCVYIQVCTRWSVRDFMHRIVVCVLYMCRYSSMHMVVSAPFLYSLCAWYINIYMRIRAINIANSQRQSTKMPYVNIHTNIMPKVLRVYVCKCTYINMNIHMHKYVLRPTCIRMYVYTCTHTHTYIHIHKHALPPNYICM